VRLIELCPAHFCQSPLFFFNVWWRIPKCAICAAGNLAKIYTATGNGFLALGDCVNAAYYFGLAEGVVSAAC
jgi:hypothetical protein